MSRRELWKEHAGPLLLFAALSLGLTWPLIARFGREIPGVSNDIQQSTWIIWQFKEALLGHQPLLDWPLLFYPYGASPLTSIPGPLAGLLGLPFWAWGPAGAINGAVLVGFTLQGYFMYRLARAWKLPRLAALFAGLLLLVAPMHLAGLEGHLTKMFFGLIPLAMLAFHHSLELDRGRRSAAGWAAATAMIMLVTLLYASQQFIFAAMAMAFWAVAGLIQAQRADRPALVRRLLLTGLLTALLTGPFLFQIGRLVTDQPITLSRNQDSFRYQPDLMQFLLPPQHNRWLGQETTDLLLRLGLSPGVESAVALPWLAVCLALLAVIKIKGEERPSARWWALFTALFVVLALGPRLMVAGETTFTEYELPVILPYAVLTSLPGIDFMRTSGRFMQLAYIGLAMTGAWGVAYLLGRWPRRGAYLAAAAMALLVIGQWPRPWLTQPLPPVPDFYRQIAADGDRYGILDLPLRPTEGFPIDMYSANYMALQMTHGKGIALGYLSRSYDRHPVLPCLLPEPEATDDVLVAGRPVSCYANVVDDLAAANYRYVVYHRPDSFAAPHRPDAWADQQARDLLATLFADQAPLVSDDMVVVYEVRPRLLAEIAPTMRLGQGWYGPEYNDEGNWRWAASPAELLVTVPEKQTACLEITPYWFYQPDPDQPVATAGVIEVEAGGRRQRMAATSGQISGVTLSLAAGENQVLLSQPAGNFRPAGENRQLSLAVSRLNLVPGGGCPE